MFYCFNSRVLMLRRQFVYLSSLVLDLIRCDFVSIKLHYYNREIFYTWGEKKVIFHTLTATFLNLE